MSASLRISDLLEKLCIELGFCLPAGEHDALVADPPNDVDRFVERVYRAEGLDPGTDPQLYAQVRARIAAVLEPVRSMRVTWPDGTVVAEVNVSPCCDPIRTPHVVGTFARGPGFTRLEPHLARMIRSRGAPEVEAALRLAERLDAIGLTATDEFGRRYDVFDVVFDEHGLLFCAEPASD